jgi:hypothetical protein
MTHFSLWLQLKSTRQGDWSTFLKKFTESVQDIIGGSVEVGDTGDHPSIALCDEIETLRGQIEHLTADVSLNTHPIPHLCDGFSRADNCESSSINGQQSSILYGPSLPAPGYRVTWAGQTYVDTLPHFPFLHVVSIESPWSGAAFGSEGEACLAITVRT